MDTQTIGLNSSKIQDIASDFNRFLSVIACSCYLAFFCTSLRNRAPNQHLKIALRRNTSEKIERATIYSPNLKMLPLKLMQIINPFMSLLDLLLIQLQYGGHTHREHSKTSSERYNQLKTLQNLKERSQTWQLFNYPFAI